MVTPMKSTIYNQQCPCGREGCPVTFAANKSRRYANRECSEYARRKQEAAHQAKRRAAGTDTISKRKMTIETRIPSNAGVRDGQTRKKSSTFADFLDAMKRRGAVNGAYNQAEYLRENNQ
jgi:hypothetical protein